MEVLEDEDCWSVAGDLRDHGPDSLEYGTLSWHGPALPGAPPRHYFYKVSKEINLFAARRSTGGRFSGPDEGSSNCFPAFLGANAYPGRHQSLVQPAGELSTRRTRRCLRARAEIALLPLVPTP